MKQVLQNLRTGETEVADVPRPALGAGQVLIRTSRSLISAGTERMLVEFGKASLIGKARSQPDKVRQAWEKIGTDGLAATVDAVRSKLDQPLALGYCNVGRVLETAAGVTTLSAGDRVVSNGPHADVVSVARNLCARIPDGVTDDDAAFAVIGAVALQGIRLAQPTLGESVAVMGLGLIGLVAVQLLRAHGCRVIGIDHNPRRLALARQFGAEVVDLGAGEDPVAAAQAFARGRGVDAVILAASTESSEPVHQAASMCRKRGRIVLVGVTGLALSRSDFYEKELTFQVSCSYGPGRYEPAYEQQGIDYPEGFVRWTAQRNFEAVLDMMAEGRLDVRPLISHRSSIADASGAYELLTDGSDVLGVLLDYADSETPLGAAETRSVVLRSQSAPSVAQAGQASVAFVGAGNYATAVLIPAFKAAGAGLRSVVSNRGVSGVHAGRKFGFESSTTDAGAAIADPGVNAVVITTRHDSHAALACAALAAGKHVFVEKPLALTLDELARIDGAKAASPDRLLMVGFNRRFAPHTERMRQLLTHAAGPRAMVMTVNAGAVPPGHWTQDLSAGGGRILGEACHFIDLMRFFAGAPIREARAVPVGGDDSAAITLRFEDGSLGTINYVVNGHKTFPKERLEIFAGGRVLQLDNFRRLRGFGWPGFRSMNLWRQDKGQHACAEAFVDAVARGGTAPIPYDEIVEVSRVSIEVAEMLR
jgi:predicted dehydrogenase